MINGNVNCWHAALIACIYMVVLSFLAWTASKWGVLSYFLRIFNTPDGNGNCGGGEIQLNYELAEINANKWANNNGALLCFRKILTIAISFYVTWQFSVYFRLLCSFKCFILECDWQTAQIPAPRWYENALRVCAHHFILLQLTLGLIDLYNLTNFSPATYLYTPTLKSHNI